jgi:hypothetical protein
VKRNYAHTVRAKFLKRRRCADSAHAILLQPVHGWTDELALLGADKPNRVRARDDGDGGGLSEKALIIVGPWAGVFVAFYLAAGILSFCADCPRWLVLTIRISAASYSAMIVLRQIFILRSAETAELVSTVVGLISILVSVVALF